MVSTVYLDTANWIDLAEGNCRSVEFEEAVSTGRLEPALSYIHVLELAKPEQRSWRRVSSYIDCIRSTVTIHWALLPSDMMRNEVEAAFARFLRIELAGLAYCDVSFADGKTCEALKQGRSKIFPMRNGRFRQWLTTLTEQ